MDNITNNSDNYIALRKRLLEQYGEKRIQEDLCRYQLMHFFITGYNGRYLFYSLEGHPVRKADSKDAYFFQMISFRAETKKAFFDSVSKYINDDSFYKSLLSLQYHRFTDLYLPLLYGSSTNETLRAAYDSEHNTCITKIPLSYFSYPMTTLLMKHMKIGEKKQGKNADPVWSDMRNAVIGEIPEFIDKKWMPESEDRLAKYLESNPDVFKDICDYALKILFPDSLYELLETILPVCQDKEGVCQITDFQYDNMAIFSKIALASACLQDDLCHALKNDFINNNIEYGASIDLIKLGNHYLYELLPLYRSFIDEVNCDINLDFLTKFYIDKMN